MTQDDIDAGFVDNEAIAMTIFGPGGAQIPVSSNPVTEQVTFTLPASLSLAKTAAPGDLTTVAAGDEVTYTFTLTNTGEVTLDDVVPLDAGPTFGGQSATAALSTFTVTSGPDGNTDGRVDTLDPVDPASATTGFTPEPALVATKTTNSVPEKEGDTLDYLFSLANTGNVSISAVSMVDPKCDGGPTFLSGDLDNDSVLDVDEIWQYSCTSVGVTQEEVDAGEVENTVTASGTPAGGNLPDTTAANITEIEAEGGLDVVKSTISVPSEAGQTLDYTFVVTNTGNVSITPGVLDDPKCAAAPALQSGDANTDDALNPTETWTYACTSIPVTQAEINASVVANTATVPGTTPNGDPLDPRSDTVNTPVVPEPDYTVTKTTSSVPTTLGQTLDYNFTVVNDGNVSIGNLILTDAKCQSAPALVSGDTNSNGTLEPTETFVFGCTSIPVTQPELDAGVVINTVTAQGNAPDGSALPAAEDRLETDVEAEPSFVLTKATDDAPLVAGDVL